MTEERWRKELFLEPHEYVLRDTHDPGSAGQQVDQSVVNSK